MGVAPAAQLEVHEAVSVRHLAHDGRTGTVAEQHGRAAVGEVQDPRVDVGGDHERVAARVGGDETARQLQPVDEAAAHHIDVEAGCGIGTESPLYVIGGGRLRGVRSRGGEDKVVDLPGSKAGALQSGGAGLQAEIRCRFVSGGITTPVYLRLAFDPFLVDADACSHLGIADMPRGYVRSGSEDSDGLLGHSVFLS